VEGSLGLRPFGSEAGDLEVDFSSAPLPMLVTDIIRACTISKGGKMPHDDFFWNLTIGQRIECMIRISTANGSRFLATILMCKEEQCKEKFELSLSRDNILDNDKSSNSDDICTINILDDSYQLRRPTGLDQVAWQKLDKYDETNVLKHIVTDLMCHSTDGPCKQIQLASYETIEEIGKNMSRIDPLIDYRIELKCPLCGIKNFYEVNLENLSLMCLKKIQKELLESIHKLALTYHWTESEILNLPTKRRQLYLSLLESR
jgi:hypothetical protein